MTTVLVVGGTTESYAGDNRVEVSGVLKLVTDRVDPAIVRGWVGYPASYAGQQSFRDSVQQGVINLSDRVRSTQGDIILLGYSQGCTVIRAYLHDAAVSPESHDRRVIAAALVADPEAPPLEGQPDRYGVLGYGQSSAPDWVQTYWCSNPRDPIAAARWDSLLRDFADFTEFFGFGDMAKWGTDVLAGLRTVPREGHTPDAINNTIAEIKAYLPRWEIGPWFAANPSGGQHVESYIRSPHLLPNVARWINSKA